MDVSEYKNIKRYLTKRIYPVSISSSKDRKRNYRRKCKDFVVINGVLHHQDNAKAPLRVLKSTEMEDYLKPLHIDESGGHLGINRTWRRVRERYYWKNSYADVKRFIKECDHCQRKPLPEIASIPPIPSEVESAPFYEIGLDLVGPLETTKNGNRYVIVITEFLTKWVEAEAIPENTAENVLRVLSRFVANHGVPEVLISCTDQDWGLYNQLNDRFCKQFEIVHCFASPCHPHPGGNTQRYNNTFCRLLAKYVNDKQADWDDKVNSILFAYRTFVHPSTEETPFYSVYGRQARLPVKLALPTSTEENLPEEELLQQRCEAFLRFKI